MPAIVQAKESGVNYVRPIRLTRRETEVLILVAEGKPSQDAADLLYISRRTVDFHLANIYQKLEVTNRAQAYYEASRRGLISVADVLPKGLTPPL